MASLLDIFGTGGTQTLGLLGGDIESARNDAQAQALYALAGSLLSGGPTGLSIARGLQQGQQAYKQAMRGSLEEQLQSTQVQDLLRRRKLEEDALKRQQMIDTAVARAYQPATSTTEYQRMTPQQLERAAEPGFEVPQTTTVTPASLDFQSLIPALRASPEGRKTLLELMQTEKAMAGELTKIGEGEKLFRINPITGEQEVVATGAPKEKATPAEIQGYNLAKSQGYMGTFLDYQTALKKAGASSTTVNIPTGEERKAATLANRMNFSVGQMNEAIGQDPSAAMPKTVAEAARFFTKSEFLANKLTPEQRQVVESAQLDVLDAALTLGTGAAYTREQLDSYRKSYFPQLGDSDKTIQSKQKRLENLLQSAQIASGRAAPSIPSRMPGPFDMPSVSGSEIPSGVTVRKRQ